MKDFYFKIKKDWFMNNIHIISRVQTQLKNLFGGKQFIPSFQLSHKTKYKVPWVYYDSNVRRKFTSGNTYLQFKVPDKEHAAEKPGWFLGVKLVNINQISARTQIGFRFRSRGLPVGRDWRRLVSRVSARVYHQPDRALTRRIMQ